MSKLPELCGCVGFLHSTVASFILSLPAAAVGSFPRLLITSQSAAWVHIGHLKIFAPPPRLLFLLPSHLDLLSLISTSCNVSAHCPATPTHSCPPSLPLFPVSSSSSSSSSPPLIICFVRGAVLLQSKSVIHAVVAGITRHRY